MASPRYTLVRDAASKVGPRLRKRKVQLARCISNNCGRLLAGFYRLDVLRGEIYIQLARRNHMLFGTILRLLVDSS